MVDIELRCVGETTPGVNVDPYASDHVAAISRQGDDCDGLGDQYLVPGVLAVAVSVDPVRPIAAVVRNGGQRGDPKLGQPRRRRYAGGRVTPAAEPNPMTAPRAVITQ